MADKHFNEKTWLATPQARPSPAGLVGSLSAKANHGDVVVLLAAGGVLVDGAYAAQFIAQVKASLESWDEQAFGL